MGTFWATSAPAIAGGYPSPNQPRADFTLVQIAQIRVFLGQAIASRRQRISDLGIVQPQQQAAMDLIDRLNGEIVHLEGIQNDPMEGVPNYAHRVSDWTANADNRAGLHLPPPAFPEPSPALSAYWHNDMGQTVGLGDMPAPTPGGPLTAAFFAGKVEEANILLTGGALTARLAEIAAEQKAAGV